MVPAAGHTGTSTPREVAELTPKDLHVTPRAEPLRLLIDDTIEAPEARASTVPLPVPVVEVTSGRGELQPRPRRPAARPQRPPARPLLYVWGGAAVVMLVAGLLLTRWVVAQTSLQDAGADTARQAEELWSALRAAERARNFSLSEQKARQLLALPAMPHSAQERAQEALAHALAEQQNLLIYDRFLQAVARRAPDAAVLAYGELPLDSVYRELGAARYAEMREAFVQHHLQQAQGALREPAGEPGVRGCRAVQPHLDAILAVEPAAAGLPAVRALQARCQGALAPAKLVFAPLP
jgi:hypothetical protein